MKINKFLWVYLLAVAIWTRCSDEETFVVQEQIEQSVQALQVVQTGSEAYTPQELAQQVSGGKFVAQYIRSMGDVVQRLVSDILETVVAVRLPEMDAMFRKELGTSLTEGRQWRVESYVFTYLSHSAAGEELRLSGRVTFPRPIQPELSHQVRSLTIYEHFDLFEWETEPSLSFSTMPLRTLFNSAVIEPDFEGYGVTRGRPHCGASFATVARQTHECVLAALEVMRRHGVTLSDEGHSTCWGYSLAGPSAMEYVRLYEQQVPSAEQKLIRLGSTYLGAGPFDLYRMVDYMDRHLDFSVSLASTILEQMGAQPASDFAPYRHQDLCPEWMQQQQIEYQGRSYTYYEAWQRGYVSMGVDTLCLADCYASDMCLPDGHFDRTNPKTALLLDLYKRLSDWSGFVPQSPIYMTHCPQEERMPYEMAVDVYQIIKENGGNIWFKDVQVPDFLTFIASRHQLSTLFFLMHAIMYEEPKEVFDSLNDDLLKNYRAK